MNLILRPEVLTHPNIPKPLHGLSPRELKGKEWWDNTRQKVYKQQDYRCTACGVHKSEAKHHKWIEAHESYHIDYLKGCMEIDSIIGLCHSCHNFIHCGRLKMLCSRGEVTEDKYFDIMNHGFKVLREAKLTPNGVQANSYVAMLVKAGKSVPKGLSGKARGLGETEKNTIGRIQQDRKTWLPLGMRKNVSSMRHIKRLAE